MCCFSQPVHDVADTRIFARDRGAGRQYLVYEMKYAADSELAMILPLPVPAKALEDDVRFINLEKYPGFFEDLDRGFPRPRAAGPPPPAQVPDKSPLKVVEVGQFEASFVPTVADFDRLDARFRLPSDTWLQQLPAYRDYGFAVFKLKAGHRHVHPMAFDFPRRNPARLFFPTVHIHDGVVHETAAFDHLLYLQRAAADKPLEPGWVESPRPVSMFMKVADAQGLLLPDAHVHRRLLLGKLKNVDTFA